MTTEEKIEDDDDDDLERIRACNVAAMTIYKQIRKSRLVPPEDIMQIGFILAAIVIKEADGKKDVEQTERIIDAYKQVMIEYIMD